MNLTALTIKRILAVAALILITLAQTAVVPAYVHYIGLVLLCVAVLLD